MLFTRTSAIIMLITSNYTINFTHESDVTYFQHHPNMTKNPHNYYSSLLHIV